MMWNKRLVLVSLLLLPVVQLHALQVTGDDTEVPEQTRTEQRREAPRDEQTSSPAAGTFTPSEKIQADSAVSFPVDI